jgi:hypothetical protein
MTTLENLKEERSSLCVLSDYYMDIIKGEHTDNYTEEKCKSEGITFVKFNELKNKQIELFKLKHKSVIVEIHVFDDMISFLDNS